MKLGMRWALAGAIVLLAAPLALAAALQADQPAAVRKAPTAKTQGEDLRVFRRQVLGREKSFTPAARAEAEARLAALEAKAGAISQPALELELARIVALADNGHSHFVVSSITRHYNRVPLRLGVFGEDAHVLRAREDHADLLGARLIAVDGRPVETLRAAARALWGGTQAFRDRYTVELFESPELLAAAGLAETKAAATYRFAAQDGTIIERRLSGDPPGPERPFSGPAQAMFPGALPLEDARWRTALDPSAAPWSLQAWPTRFRSRAAPELSALVLDMRQNNDGAGFKIAEATKGFEAEIARARPRNLILDMRWNGGGDLTTSRSFMQALPGKVPGRIFVLTSPFTFSAGISSVGYLKQAAPGRVVIVGEAVGDRQVFFSEGDGVRLPNSQGMVGYAVERHDYAGGCKAFRDCHHNIVRHPIAVASLAPDIPAPWTIEAYLAGRDPAMEAVARVVGGGGD